MTAEQRKVIRLDYEIRKVMVELGKLVRPIMHDLGADRANKERNIRNDYLKPDLSGHIEISGDKKGALRNNLWFRRKFTDPLLSKPERGDSKTSKDFTGGQTEVEDYNLTKSDADLPIEGEYTYSWNEEKSVNWHASISTETAVHVEASGGVGPFSAKAEATTTTKAEAGGDGGKASSQSKSDSRKWGPFLIPAGEHYQVLFQRVPTTTATPVKYHDVLDFEFELDFEDWAGGQRCGWMIWDEQGRRPKKGWGRNSHFKFGSIDELVAFLEGYDLRALKMESFLGKCSPASKRAYKRLKDPSWRTISLSGTEITQSEATPSIQPVKVT